MHDTPLDAYIRKEKGLPDNWRVYLFEVVGQGKVRLTGALARPGTKEEGATDIPMLIKPLRMRHEKTISMQLYRNLVESAPKVET